MKKKVILSSILSLILCVSLIAGGTFALFTSEDKANITITSGNVAIDATVELESVYTPKVVSADGVVDAENIAVAPNFGNAGGSVAVEDGKVSLNNMMPGDKVVLKVTTANNSNVAFVQRMLVKCTDADKALFNELWVGVSDSADAEPTYYADFASAWEKSAELYANGDAVKYITIEMPAYVGDDFQGMTANLTVTVMAVQGNAAVTDADSKLLAVVADQAELDDAIANAEDGDTIYVGAPVDALTVANTNGKNLTFKGYSVKTFTVNAPEGTIKVFNNATVINAEEVAMNSLHVFGKVETLTVGAGRIVVENAAKVETVEIAPAANKEVVLFIPTADEAATVGEVAQVVVDAVAEGAKVNVIAPVEAKPEVSGAAKDEVTQNTVAAANSADALQAAIDAAQDGDIVVINNDITAAKSIVVDGKKVTLDINATILGNGCDGVIQAINNADVTLIGNGTVQAQEVDSYSMAVWAKDAKVTINGDIYFVNESINGEEGMDLIYASKNAVVEILNGKFESAISKWTLNLKDNDGGQFVVKGGEFKNYNPAVSYTENPPQNFLADGYATFVDGEWYKVSTLQAEFDAAAAGDTIVVASDINADSIVVPANITLKAVDGVTFNVPKLAVKAHYMTVGAGATLENLSFKATVEDTTKAGVVMLAGPNVTVKDCAMDLTGTKYNGFLVGGETAAENATTTFVGCDFVGGFEPISCGDGTKGNGGGTPGDVVVDSCKFSACTYSIHLNITANDLTVKDSTLYSWITIYGNATEKDTGKVLFEGCTLTGSGYISAYRDMTFEDCTIFETMGVTVKKSGQSGEGAFTLDFVNTTGANVLVEKIINDPEFAKDFSVTLDGEAYDYTFADKTWTVRA